MSGTNAPPVKEVGSASGKFSISHDGWKAVKVGLYAAAGVFIASTLQQVDLLQASGKLEVTGWVALVVAILRAGEGLFRDTRSKVVAPIIVIGILGVLLAASPVSAGTKTMKDVQGHRYAVDTNTQITPGAGSGLGALIGDAIDTTALYVQHDWDLSFGFQGTGANNDSGEEEIAMASLEIAKFFSKNIKLGLELSRPNLAVPEVYAVAPTFQATLFTHPYDSWSKGLRVKLFSWNQAIGENEMLSGGAFSVEWQATAFAAWPVGWGSLQVDAGLKRTFTALSEDVPDKSSIVGGFRANVWLVR